MPEKSGTFLILSCHHVLRVSEDMFRLYKKGQSVYCPHCKAMRTIINKFAST